MTGKTKTLNGNLVAARTMHGCAAAIAYNDPAIYPAGGDGVKLATHSSDRGLLEDVARALVLDFVKSALDDGIDSIIIFSTMNLYYDHANVENIMGCKVCMVGLDDLADRHTADPVAIRSNIALDAVEEMLEKLKQADKDANEAAACEAAEKPELVPGQYVLYKNGDRYELGRVKRVTENGAFVWYSAGDTASKTPFDCLVALENARNIISTDLGGSDAKAMFPEAGNE